MSVKFPQQTKGVSYLVPDCNKDDLASRIEWEHVCADPVLCKVRVTGQSWNVAVGRPNYDSDPSVSQGFDYGRVRSIQPDLLDGG